jgi:phosphate transport system permease protein
MFVLAVMAAVLLTLGTQAWPVFARFGLSFFSSSEWDTVNDQYGALAPILGTLLTSLIALLIAVPLSLGIAVFVTELSPEWLKGPVGTAIELLAAVPSVIFGMWGLFVFAPLFGKHVHPWISKTFGTVPVLRNIVSGPPIGIGTFTAGFILALMILPFITATIRDVFEIVPVTLRESAYVMGSTTWEVVSKVILPYTKAGVVSGIILGLGRALGETMAVTFVIGNSHHLTWSLFMPATTISATIANDFAEASAGLHQSALIALGFLLFVITSIVLTISKLVLYRLAQLQEGENR